MKPHRGIDLEAVVTVDGTTVMSCQVLSDEIEFRFGPLDTGLHLFFDPPGLANFLKVVANMVEHLGATSSDGKRCFKVTSDGEGHSDEQALT
jgi:hypothetical protein